jgi:hypothetical protein
MMIFGFLFALVETFWRLECIDKTKHVPLDIVPPPGLRLWDRTDIDFFFSVLAGTCRSYDIFPKNHEFVYKIKGQILLVPDAEREQPNVSNDNTMWAMVGNLMIQNKQVGLLSVRV